MCGGNLDNVSTADINDCRCAGVVMIRMIKFTMVIGKNIIVMMVMLVRQVSLCIWRSAAVFPLDLLSPLISTTANFEFDT